MAACIGIHIHMGIHVAHVLEGQTEVFARKSGLECIKDNGCFTDVLECAVKPFRGVAPRKRVHSERNLEEREPFGITFLADIWLQGSWIEARLLATDFNLMKHILTIGHELTCRAGIKQCQDDSH